MAFIQALRSAREEAARRTVHPWAMQLEALTGAVGEDGVERVTTQAIFDELDVPQRARTAGACRTLAGLMRSLGWTSVRVRGLTRGGYREQVRGYAREVRPSRSSRRY